MSTRPRDGAERWEPNEPPPSNFDQSAYQQRIDEIVGTRDGRPIIKLAWAPQEFRWWPHRCGEDPRGYVFPIFHAYTDSSGNLIAAPRWVLLERIEPSQYAPTPQFWEAKRYQYDDGSLWDMTGPCPSERYVELRCHSYHDQQCCLCIGDTCRCGVEYDHCWGRYAEPNENLLNWIRKKAWEARNDSDVKPNADVRAFEAPGAQRNLVTTLAEAQEKGRQQRDEFNNDMLSYWQRKPHGVYVKQSDSGLYLPN